MLAHVLAHLAGILGCLGLILGHLGRSWRHLWHVGGLSRNISVRPCRFIWLVGVHFGPSWLAHAALSGLLGSILAHLGQPMPFHLVCRGPSCPILASPCRFIWLVWVHLGARASPCRFCWFLGVHLEQFWGGSFRFICRLGIHLGPFQSILGQPLPL